jgi:hypothetical protein
VRIFLKDFKRDVRCFLKSEDGFNELEIYLAGAYKKQHFRL